MNSIDTFLSKNYSEDLVDLHLWCENQYRENFENCFKDVRDLKRELESNIRTVSDLELEWVLTELPMTLFDVSENLNRFRLDMEVIKLKKKSIKLDLSKSTKMMIESGELDKSEVKNYIDAQIAEHDIVITAFNYIINRVESEISFSKELIMGCKKIWDSRRRAEESNPAGEVVPEELPNYSESTGFKSSYIK